MGIYKLDNPVMEYQWGSKESFSELFGYPNPNGVHQAELWMGAHPKAPSKIDGVPLGEFIGQDPEGVLGHKVVKRFGKRLPFLFKVIAAGSPLSIQAHPTLEDAIDRFKSENESGIPIDSPNRNYLDPNHKPEILMALTPFSVLWGFRPLSEISQSFKLLGPEGEILSDKRSLEEFFVTLMNTDQPRLERMLSLATTPGILPENHEGAVWVRTLAEKFPGDVGILAPLYLNLFELRPKEAIYVPSGELHAYLEGTGIELMANSDNVIRGGLTKKHIDVDELCSILSYNVRVPSKVLHINSNSTSTYHAPAPEFLLSRLHLHQKRVPTQKIVRQIFCCEILFALSGSTIVEWSGGSFHLESGDSYFVTADTDSYSIQGDGVVCLASIPGME